MMKKYLILLLTVFALNSCEDDTTIIDATTADKKMVKVDVCHYNADTDTWETLYINGNALKAHLGHGDYRGECSDLVEICHYDAETNTRETISVRENELEEHLEHGDYEGECREGYTYVPDDNFENELIRLKLDDVPDNYVLTSNIEGVTELYVSNKWISDLTGIKDFTALKILYASSNQLVDLDVSGLAYLEILLVNSSQLAKIDVSGNKALKVLSAYLNQLTELDVSELTALERLFVDGNQLTELDVSGNTALSRLEVDVNQLTELRANNGRTLNVLIAYGNPLGCIEVFSEPKYFRVGHASFSPDCGY